jgi:hypothetical protein
MKQCSNLLWITILACSSAAHGQEPHVQLSKPDGWPIPALKLISSGAVRPKVQKTLSDDGVRVHVFNVIDRRQQERSATLPFLWPVKGQQNHFVYEEVTLAASTVTVYEFKGRRFAYVVEGSRFVYDPRSKSGGFAGELRVLYEDRNGDEKFELVHEEFPRDYFPTIPEWVKR